MLRGRRKKLGAASEKPQQIAYRQQQKQLKAVAGLEI